MTATAATKAKRGARPADLFAGFATSRVEVNGVSIHLRYGGTGPPVLLLHGYPQTHVMWHWVAPVLSEWFTVVCPDLRGYGDSAKPSGGEDHQAYAKRTMAQDQIDVMARLGFDRFALAGHDRGARVALRLALDTIHASCEDYRAGATIDLAHDHAEHRTVSCPTLAIWSRQGLGEQYDVAAIWKALAPDLRCAPTDSGHFIAEERPAETATQLGSFFSISS